MNYSKIIFDKKECIGDFENEFYYKYEYLNNCFAEFPNGTINNSFICEPIIITEEFILKTSEYINELSTYIVNINNEIVINIQNVFNISINKEKINEQIYLEQKKEYMLAAFTSTNYLKINNSNKIMIDLGICEDILKKLMKFQKKKLNIY